jgi:hypothetical protein
MIWEENASKGTKEDLAKDRQFMKLLVASFYKKSFDTFLLSPFPLSLLSSLPPCLPSISPFFPSLMFIEG